MPDGGLYPSEPDCLRHRTQHIITVSPDFQSKPKTLFIYGTADEEFPESVYEGITDTIEAYCGEVDITVVEGLGHKTNQESRERTAQYIKSQFAI